MTNHIVRPKPLSLQESENLFLDDEGYTEHPFGSRFADSYARLRYRNSCAKRLDRPYYVHECRSCRRQISHTAATFAHWPHVPLRSWYRAILLDDRRFQRRLGFGHKKAAWLLQKTRWATRDTDETSVSFRSKPSELPYHERCPRGRQLSKVQFYRYIADLGKPSGAGL